MRLQNFGYAPEESSGNARRHLARSLNFEDQSIFSYSSPGQQWWGYR